jgi:DNA-binding response OmpR family regulator
MRSILIAEGHEEVAQLLADLFARDGWAATTYSNGRRAAEALGGSSHYDAVLVSNQLDGMNGVKLITRIRALAHRQDVPIVMVTGAADVAVVAAALAAGADGVLHKPNDVDILVDAVKKCVERRRKNTSE